LATFSSTLFNQETASVQAIKSSLNVTYVIKLLLMVGHQYLAVMIVPPFGNTAVALFVPFMHP
jgi:hypothetical protein